MMLLEFSDGLFYIISQIILMIFQSFDDSTQPFVPSPLHRVNKDGILYEPKIVNYGTSVIEDVYRIGNATKYHKTDMIVDLLLSRTNAERQNIKEKYNSVLRKSLLNENENIKSNLVYVLFQDLLTDSSNILGGELNKAVILSDLKRITSILIDFWGEEFNEVEKIYKLSASESLWNSIGKKFGKSVESVLRCVVETRKIEPQQEYPVKGRGGKPIVNESVVLKAFNDLMNVSHSNEVKAEQLGEILCKLNPFEFETLDIVFQRSRLGELNVYTSTDHQEIYPSIFEIFQAKTIGPIHNVLVALYNYSINKPLYFATIIHDELHKELTDFLSLQRLLLLRSEIDLHTIDKVYKTKYGMYLSEDVKKIYVGEYGERLLKLLQKKEIPDIFQQAIPVLPPVLQSKII
ncbi:unnamed protein product [Schistosoma turkestanicum]|nr:unnamed protein product [Schistosoma turkestanicum]CAH8537874.1 unnamed protein product [Schistosoma turkestanicum]